MISCKDDDIKWAMTVSLFMSHSLFCSIRDVVSTRPKGFSWFWLIVTQIYAGESMTYRRRDIRKDGLGFFVFFSSMKWGIFMRGRKVQGSGGVAEFTKMWKNLQKIWQNLQKMHSRAFCSCRNGTNFVNLPCLFQPKTIRKCAK